MLDSWLRWLANAIDARPRRIAIACLLATLCAAIIVTRIPVTTDILDVMPDNTPSIIAFTDFLRDFGVLGGLVVVVEATDEAADTLVAVVQALGEQLSVSPYVESVDYNLLRSGFRLAAAHFPIYLDARGITGLAERLTPTGIRSQMRANRDSLLSPLASPLDAEAIRRDPLNIRQFVRDGLGDRLPAKSLDLSTGYYLDRSHTVAFLMVRPKGSTRDMSFVRGLQREMRRIAARVVEQEGSPRNLKIGFAGGFARAAEAASVIWQDMVVSFAVSLALVLLILYVAFRPPAVVVGTFVVTLLTALVWTLLLAYTLYGRLNIVTSIASAMLIGLFVDYMINTYKRFDECYRLCGNSLQALEKTLTGTGKAIVSGALTTAVSFFSVVITSFRGMHELGVVAGFGIIFCLVATLVLMAAILAWLAQSWPTCLAAGRPADLGATRIAGLVERKRAAVIACFVVLLVFGGIGVTRVRFDATVETLGLRESAVQATEEKAQQVLGRRGEPLFLVARATGEDQLAADFDALEQQGKRWRSDGKVGSFSSAGMLLPPPSAQREALAHLSREGFSGALTGAGLSAAVRKEMTRYGLVADDSLDSYTAGIARALASREVVTLPELSRAQDPRVSYYYNRDRRALAAHLTPPDSGWDRISLAALEDDVRRLGADFRLVGPAKFLDEIRTTILWEAGAAVLLSFAANLGIVALHFRSWRRVGLVMLPVTVGTVLTVGTMGILGLRFNFFNVAGIALIFGFGVDYGIYLMQTYLEEHERAGSAAVQSVGGVVILCAVTTVVSCGSLVTTHYRGLASIGTVLCLGALFCLASTLLLLPSLLRPSGKEDAAT